MNMKQIVILISFLVTYSISYAQKDNISKVVVVESEYRPEIESAEKISTIPQLTDTSKTKPNVEYTVLPSGIRPEYKVKPIKPAKLVGSKLDELYNSRLKLGLGNYFTPLAEFSIQNLRSKKYTVGAYVYHKSSHSKLELADGNNVDAGYGKNRVDVYGKRFYRGVNVDGNVFLNTDKLRYYGYNTEGLPDTTLDKKEIRQFYTHLGAKAEVYSTVADSSELEYRIGLHGSYFADDYKNRENNMKIPMKFGFMVQSFRVELNADYNLYARTLNSIDSKEQVFHFRPMVLKAKDQWQVQFGANMYYAKENETNFHFYPEAKFRFSVIDKVLEAFVGIYGKLDLNSLQDLSKENPYILPGLQVENTSHKLVGFGGVEGVLSSNSGYRGEVSFNTIENAYFFINDTNDALGNKFIAVTDNIDVVSFKGELWYSPLSFLDFYLKGRYDDFSMARIEQPWHKPAFSMSFRTAYNFKEKIYANFDIIQLGKRYAFNSLQPNTPVELAPVWDLNLSIEYKYSEVLSAFIEGNNLLAKQYYLWNQYPSQKINVMVGFSYKF